MKKMVKAAAVLVTVCAVAFASVFPAFARAESETIYVKKAASKPVIDGTFNADEWKDAKVQVLDPDVNEPYTLENPGTLSRDVFFSTSACNANVSEITDISFINFSDSIVFYTKDDSYEVFKMLIDITCFFMNCVICGQSLMVKGAIAHGEFYVDTGTNSYVGKALIDAYLLEEELNWLALGIHKTVEKTEPYKKFSQDYNYIIKCPDIPLKKSDELISCINWADNTIIVDTLYNPYLALNTMLERKKKELQGESNKEELEKVKLRIKNTINFLNLFHRDNNMRCSIFI